MSGHSRLRHAVVWRAIQRPSKEVVTARGAQSRSRKDADFRESEELWVLNPEVGDKEGHREADARQKRGAVYLAPRDTGGHVREPETDHEPTAAHYPCLFADHQAQQNTEAHRVGE